jgi:HEAT repeat protein
MILCTFLLTGLATAIPCSPPWAQEGQSVESLIYDLKNPDAKRRKEAVKKLGESGSPDAVPALVAAAGDTDPDVRREILITLDDMADARALPAFVRLSADPDPKLRDRSLNGILRLYLSRESGLGVTLGRVATFLNPWSDEWADVIIEPYVEVDPTAITALANRLEDDEEDISMKAVRALGILKGRAAVPRLIHIVHQDRSNAMRFEAMRSIRKIGDPSVAPELMNLLSYNDDKVRNEAVYTIGRFRYRDAVPELTRLYQEQMDLPKRLGDLQYRRVLLEALAYIADPGSKGLFINERMNPDDELRLHAVEGLARIGDAAIVTDISRQWLREEDDVVKTALAYALYRMKRDEYLDELVAGLSRGKTKAAATKYLIEFTPEELPALYQQANNNDVSIREGLAEILGLIGDDSSVPVLQKLSEDDRGNITRIANEAIRRIHGRFNGH